MMSNPSAIKLIFPDFQMPSPVKGDQIFLYISLGSKLVDVRNPNEDETVIYLPATTNLDQLPLTISAKLSHREVIGHTRLSVISMIKEQQGQSWIVLSKDKNDALYGSPPRSHDLSPAKVLLDFEVVFGGEELRNIDIDSLGAPTVQFQEIQQKISEKRSDIKSPTSNLNKSPNKKVPQSTEKQFERDVYSQFQYAVAPAVIKYKDDIQPFSARKHSQPNSKLQDSKHLKGGSLTKSEKKLSSLAHTYHETLKNVKKQVDDDKRQQKLTQKSDKLDQQFYENDAAKNELMQSPKKPQSSPRKDPSIQTTLDTLESLIHDVAHALNAHGGSSALAVKTADEIYKDDVTKKTKRALTDFDSLCDKKTKLKSQIIINESDLSKEKVQYQVILSDVRNLDRQLQKKIVKKEYLQDDINSSETELNALRSLISQQDQEINTLTNQLDKFKKQQIDVDGDIRSEQSKLAGIKPDNQLKEKFKNQVADFIEAQEQRRIAIGQLKQLPYEFRFNLADEGIESEVTFDQLIAQVHSIREEESDIDGKILDLEQKMADRLQKQYYEEKNKQMMKDIQTYSQDTKDLERRLSASKDHITHRSSKLDLAKLEREKLECAKVDVKRTDAKVLDVRTKLVSAKKRSDYEDEMRDKASMVHELEAALRERQHQVDMLEMKVSQKEGVIDDWQERNK